jgi:recombination protein RecR
LHLIKHRDKLLTPLAAALAEARDTVVVCSRCGNVDSSDPCSLCNDRRRDPHAICVVEDVSDLWALERAAAWNGQYHVLGGTLSRWGCWPEDDRPARRTRRSAGNQKSCWRSMQPSKPDRALHHRPAQTLPVKLSRLAHGVPVGGELDYLDEGTLTAAIRSRRPF